MQEEAWENEYTKSTMQVAENITPNEVLLKLLPHVEIHAFQEKVPTINEIFIEAVR